MQKDWRYVQQSTHKNIIRDQFLRSVNLGFIQKLKALLPEKKASEGKNDG